jgi:serine/threonine protein phosphatase PrpC/predicted Ser/Thr protein kinase
VTLKDSPAAGAAGDFFARVDVSRQLKISLGQHSDKGRKSSNQDFHGACIPQEPQLSAKGIAIALADGISTSSVSQAASQATVKSLLEDYYCTSHAWSVRKSVQQVLTAINSWLWAQTRQSQFRYEIERGYVCTLSALVLKSNTAYLFHVGDARIFRVRGGALEQLTQDHRVWVSQEQSHLSRAFGMQDEVDIDYQALPLAAGDVFFCATDGVHEFVSARFVAQAIAANPQDLDTAARAIVAEALERGSIDNLTAQIVRIEELPDQDADEILRSLSELPFPPLLVPRELFDGYRIVRELHASARSHVYLASDDDTRPPVVIKTLSTELQQDAAQVDRFLMEDWIARRINNAHVMRPIEATRTRNFIYTVSEYIDGQTLSQWLIDNPKPDLETVRGIVEQIAKGVTAFHRLEMLHQDLRPANVMIDRRGTVKIVDFGSTRVAGIAESSNAAAETHLLGTMQYTAPEYFLGEPGTPASDQFSLGVIAYQMLSGRLPYGAEVSRSRTRAAQRKLAYRTVLDDEREIPAWIDDVLKKATHPDPLKRYQELSEFVHDLRHPNAAYLDRTRRPLLERNPAGFWKGVSLLLALVVAALLIRGT